MKTTSAILINSALLAVALAMIPLLSVAQSPYSDTYINKASLQKEAEEVKKQRELEAQRQLEYEKWYKEQQEAQKVTNNQPQKETIKKPEDFASYAEYREYLDGLGQRTKQNVNSANTSQGNQQQQGGTVVNNYYVNTPPQQSQQVVTTSVVYDPFWDSPSVTMGLFFDPWYMTSYRVRYYRSSYYWRDPFWDYPWAYSYYGWNYYDPWGWSNSYNRGFRDGYMAFIYSQNLPTRQEMRYYESDAGVTELIPFGAINADEILLCIDSVGSVWGVLDLSSWTPRKTYHYFYGGDLYTALENIIKGKVEETIIRP